MNTKRGSKQRSKGERLGWESASEVTRRKMSELVNKGGRVKMPAFMPSCKKLIP